jgi:hypothetical protein
MYARLTVLGLREAHMFQDMFTLSEMQRAARVGGWGKESPRKDGCGFIMTRNHTSPKLGGLETRAELPEFCLLSLIFN